MWLLVGDWGGRAVLDGNVLGFFRSQDVVVEDGSFFTHFDQDSGCPRTSGPGQILVGRTTTKYKFLSSPILPPHDDGQTLKIPGNSCMIIGGNNIGRVGIMEHREKHPGSFEIVHLKDSEGHKFATRLQNVMVIGEGDKPWVSLPKGRGIKLSNVQDRKLRMTKA